jgi:hypothetical protein
MNPNEENNVPKTEQGMQAIKIGELKQPKSRMTSLIMFVVITLFIAVVFFLPDINNFVKKMTEPPVPVDKTSTITFEDNNNDFFAINSNSKIFISNHRLSMFTINSVNSTLEFKITHYNNEQSNIDGKNWYINFYDRDKNLIDFVKITGQIVGKDQELNFKVNLTEQTKEAAYMKIGKISENEYPEITYLTNDQNEKYFVCEKDSKEYSYFFNEHKLYKVIEEYNANYAEIDRDSNVGEGSSVKLSEVVKETYQLKHNNFAGTSYANSSFAETDEGFIFRVEIDLTDGQYSSTDDKYFSKDMDAKVLNFQMKSQGYNCQ